MVMSHICYYYINPHYQNFKFKRFIDYSPPPGGLLRNPPQGSLWPLGGAERTAEGTDLDIWLLSVILSIVAFKCVPLYTFF